MGTRTDPDQGTLQRAKLAVQYHSQATQLELRGASAVMLPPELEPMPLEAALEIMDRCGERRQAAWTLIRNSAPPPIGVRAREREYTIPQRYPRVLRRHARDIGFDLWGLDELRGQCRAGARWFAAALYAHADDEPKLAELLTAKLSSSTLSATVEDVGALTTEGGDAQSAADWMGSLLAAADPEAAATMIRDLEREMAVDLPTFIGEFADTMAFMRFWQDGPGEKEEDTGFAVFPTTIIVQQDPPTLTTTVTATSLVKTKDFDAIARTIDPRRWCHYGSIFKTARFVDDPFALNPVECPDPVGRGLEQVPRLVEEEVRILSGLDGDDVGYFHNVISIDRFEVARATQPSDRKAELRFSLERSVDSRFLWDVRPGGILFDSGRTSIHCIAAGAWRVTSRKMIRFADRTQYTGWDGPQDFGQAMNYLAPAVLSAWMENDMYSVERPDARKE